MSDEIQAVKAQFIEYSEVFNDLKPDLILPFFHLPSILITTTQVATMTKEQEVLGVFTGFMNYLGTQNFTRSKLDVDNLSAKMLSENIAIVGGSAIRYKKDQKTDEEEIELERIGITYTFRKVDDKDNPWKIICGIIHDPGSNS